MKVKTKRIRVKTRHDHEYIDITDEAQSFVKETGINQGILNIFSEHTTAAITIQEADEDMHSDTKEFLKDILPLNKKYRHDYEGNINATAHIKNQLFGSSTTIPIINGNLALGTWQRIFFIEFFKARNREVILTIIGE
ncbi:MAG: YjbQ family protein [Candidatus Diapherotrites archaeon]|nr:YjbQ family protein [Candidatus Diapherotrites archaeon]